MELRRRTDLLPPSSGLPTAALERARMACAMVTETGFGAAVAIQVPDAGGQGVPVAAVGRVEPLLDVARGLAARVARDGRPLAFVDTEGRRTGIRWRHAGMPIGRTANGTIVLVVSDTNLAQREAQALATWAAPMAAGGMRVRGGPCAPIARSLIREFDADVVALALFARSGILLNVFVRTGGLLHTCRVPADTVWGEVARHGAAFTLGDLHMHAGAQLLGSVGMRSAGLVGLENGSGLAIGALGVASADELAIDVAHGLLARAPGLGPEIMARLSSTTVPVPDEDGTVDLKLLAARVGCRRFAIYERDGEAVRLVAAHTHDGSRLMTAPDQLEEQLVQWAASEGVGVTGDDAAAVAVGDHTVLYAADASKRALDCLRLALQDVRRNPFSAEQLDVDVDADAA